jgi:hypothetical protein
LIYFNKGNQIKQDKSRYLSAKRDEEHAALSTIARTRVEKLIINKVRIQLIKFIKISLFFNSNFISNYPGKYNEIFFK